MCPVCLGHAIQSALAGYMPQNSVALRHVDVAIGEPAFQVLCMPAGDKNQMKGSTAPPLVLGQHSYQQQNNITDINIAQLVITAIV